jgi:hypothetical protein
VRLLLDNNLWSAWSDSSSLPAGMSSCPTPGPRCGLAASHATSPSVVLIRRLVGRRAGELAGVLLANLELIEDDLKAGSIIAMEQDSMRIRRLPIV